VACFDTAFHHDLPRVARLLPIPRRYEAQGVRGTGFTGCRMRSHGRTGRLAGAERHKAGSSSPTSAMARAWRRCVTANRGHEHEFHPDSRGADEHPLRRSRSRTAVVSGEHRGLRCKRFNEMVNYQSGLLGVSETSSDMHDLLDRETQDVRAAEAVALFCYQVKKWIGAFAAALGGLDTLVFAGGIGENAPTVRARICDGWNFWNRTRRKRNAANEGVISAAASRVAVRVIRTDEEWMIAKTVCAFLALAVQKKSDL